MIAALLATVSLLLPASGTACRDHAQWLRDAADARYGVDHVAPCRRWYHRDDGAWGWSWLGGRSPQGPDTAIRIFKPAWKTIGDAMRLTVWLHEEGHVRYGWSHTGKSDGWGPPAKGARCIMVTTIRHACPWAVNYVKENR